MSSAPPPYQTYQTNPPVGAPAQPGKPWLKWVGLGCGGLLVLVAAFVFLMFFVVKKATSGPEEVVKGFLSAAGSGDYAKAYDTFSEPLKQAQTLEAFTQMVESNPMLFQVADTTFNNRSVDLSGAELSGTVKLRAGTKMPASFKLVKENDRWKLIAYHIGSR